MAQALITGANRGIGLELCKQLKAKGFELIATCRKASPELKDLGCNVIEKIDVTSEDSLKTLAKEMSGKSIDLLICNAGLLHGDQLGSINYDNALAQFQVNSLGPLRTVEALQGCLGQGAKVAIVTSRMGSMSDNSSGGAYGYRMSKAAVNAAGVSLAQDLKPKGVAVMVVHPGWVRTEMTGHNGLIEPPESAAGILKQIDALSLESTGCFMHQSGEKLNW